MSPRDVEGQNLSHAWIRALEGMLTLPGHAAVNFNVRISPGTPELEDARIRCIADRLLRDAGLQSIKSIRNTIFPATWAGRLEEPSELAGFYREQYETIRRFPKNKAGTYFGRLVAYPMGRENHDEPFDQLTDLVDKLRAESRVRVGGKRARKLSSRYQINIWKPGDIPNGRGFPCMAHMAFHLVDGRLHLLAQYRNQYLIERAYGNYLGLAQLQRYVAKAVGLDAGELMVIAGHASIDTHGKVNVPTIRAAVADALAIEEDNATAVAQRA
jgi:hypothetical protein